MEYDDNDAIRVQLIHPIRTHGTDITTVGERVEIHDSGLELRIDDAVKVFVPFTNLASIEVLAVKEVGE